MTEDFPIDVYTAEEDSQYESLLRRLESAPPPGPGRDFDFASMSGGCDKRTAKAIVLYLTCRNHWSIIQLSERLGVSTTVVTRLLHEAIQEAVPIDDVEVIRKFELCKLDSMARVCTEQFERSCEDAIEEVERWEIDDDKGRPVEVEEGTPGARRVIRRTRKGQSGNPAYQRMLMEIAKHRDKLLGLARPTRVEIDKTERKMVVNLVEVKDRSELESDQKTKAIATDGA